MCAGAAVQKLMMKIDKEQELLMNIADIAIDAYQAESILLRAIKMKEKNDPNADIATDILRTFISDAADRIAHAAKNAINAFADGDDLRIMLMGLKRFTKTDNFNTKDARRRIAVRLVEEGKYWI